MNLDDHREPDPGFALRLRRELQDMVRANARSPRPRRWPIVVSVGALFAAGAVVGAIVLTAPPPPAPPIEVATASIQVACLDRADLAGVEDALTVTVTRSAADGVSHSDAQSACRALWDDGTIAAPIDRDIRVSAQDSGQATEAPQGRLAVCALADGRPGVIPGPATICEALGLEPWRPEP